MKTNADPVKSYYAKCLQTDLPGAIGSLRALDKRRSSRREQELYRRVDQRFVSRVEPYRVNTKDPLVSNVIRAYRDYYRDALLNLRQLGKIDQQLEQKVRAIASEFGLSVKKNQNWKSVEQRLAKAFLERGYHALFGKVTPLKSLLIWRRERRRVFSVPLLSGPERVEVVFLEDFVELGWLHFASFGRYYVGGWAKNDALYCVAQAYRRKLNREAFTVSYLTHEAQHFSDYKNFAGLCQADLEYRAKLAELAASSRPGRLMKKFIAEARNDPRLPHSYAAYRIVSELSCLGAQGRTLSAAARECLRDHSLSIKAR